MAGEYSAAIPLAMEWSMPRRRGLMSGLILSMAPWAQATIAFAVAAPLAMLGPEQYAVWGWRALFVAGAALSIGMMLYYRRHVVDAPQARRAPASAAPSAPRPGLRSLLTGRWASAFWAAFVLMTGLWSLTDSTVLLLTARLSTDSPIAPEAVPLVMGAASIAQALVMVLAGHLSSLVGRRLLLVVWGAVAGLVGPVLWWAAVTAPTLAVAAAARRAAAGRDGLRLRSDRRLSLRAVPHRDPLDRLRLRLQPLPRAAGAVPVLRAGARAGARPARHRDGDGRARRVARGGRGGARPAALPARDRRGPRHGRRAEHAMSPADDPDLARALPVLAAVREAAPLVHCLTATVSMQLVADGSLAAGARPMMTETAVEAPVVTTVADAPLINLGTLSTDAMDGIPATVAVAREDGRPWVLDPTAIGIAPVRTPLARRLIARRPTAVRGNASEILALVGEAGGGRGADSTAAAESAAGAAAEVARKHRRGRRRLRRSGPGAGCEPRGPARPRLRAAAARDRDGAACSGR
ncbi:MFS transporter [Brachybacterium sp. GPGPB12]|uniref:MFS transporter n=1 Tax=Brachybacterium sp. GPGPB12 TaxID=3023517 RepID=UPI0031346347